jgi:opacity protein-like surface antigen
MSFETPNQPERNTVSAGARFFLTVAAFVCAASAAAQTAAPRRCADSEHHRFDFWIGEWDVTTPDGQHVGSSVIQSVSGGCAILENWTDRHGGTGKSLNGYNPTVKQWQQFWIGQGGEVSEYRSSQFDGKSLAFFIKDDATPLVLHRLTFTPIDSLTVRQHSENSEDGGKSWKTEYDFYYHRKAS